MTRVHAALCRFLQHWLSAYRTFRCALIDTLFLPCLKTFLSHVLSETTILAEVVEDALYLMVKHLHQSLAENKKSIGTHLSIIIVYPLAEPFPLAHNMEHSLAKPQVVSIIIRLVQTQLPDSIVTTVLAAPTCLVVQHQPEHEVVGKFVERCPCHIHKLHLSLKGSLVSSRTFSHIRRHRASSLSHLIQPTPLRINIITNEAPAERHRAKLQDMRHHPRVKTHITSSSIDVYRHDCSILISIPLDHPQSSSIILDSPRQSSNFLDHSRFPSIPLDNPRRQSPFSHANLAKI